MATTAASAGLTQQEAERKLASRPAASSSSSRSYKSIVLANVFTVFNLILLAAGVVTLSFGEWQDALFLAVLVANSGIGIAQEVRAKRTLDRLAALVAPTATVVRDQMPRRVEVEEVVDGDVVVLEPGDQVVADGVIRRSDGLAVDESILTGESTPVTRAEGEEVRSGSFAVEGGGAYVVTAVGDASYAARLAGEAREFRHPRSPLERAINRLLFLLVAILVPLGVALVWALYRRHTSLHAAVPTTVAAVVTLVPEGLILLTSLTFAVAGVRMARRGALAQQLNAIESLASVDTICLDKTGTLTDAHIRVEALVPADGVDEGELAHALGRFAASSPTRNATLTAIGEHCSRRRRGAPGGRAVLVAAAMERARARRDDVRPRRTRALPARLAAGDRRRASARRPARRRIRHGGRHVSDDEPLSIGRLLGIVVLAERLRADARETVEFLRSQGVRLLVISGDRPETVAAVAADAGIEAGEPLDGSDLPDDPAALRRLIEAHNVIGRIAPQDKKRVVEALASNGRYVAMVGDGVNDVPALKAARLSIAQGSGSQMARAVSDLVLVRGDFASMPALVAEGRKVLRNLQRVAKLFVAKSAFATFLVLSIGLTPQAYPLLPRHLSLAASLTIGIPAFFLALGPSEGRFRSSGFLFDVGRFAVPAGTAAGLGVLASFVFARNVARLPLTEARTIATTVLVLVGLYLVLALEATSRRRAAAVGTLAASMLALYALVLAFPFARHFFALDVPGFGGATVVLLGAALAIFGLWFTDDRFVPGAVRDRPSS